MSDMGSKIVVLFILLLQIHIFILVRPHSCVLGESYISIIFVEVHLNTYKLTSVQLLHLELVVNTK